jgi:hypothetical protein
MFVSDLLTAVGGNQFEIFLRSALNIHCTVCKYGLVIHSLYLGRDYSFWSESIYCAEESACGVAKIVFEVYSRRDSYEHSLSDFLFPQDAVSLKRLRGSGFRAINSYSGYQYAIHR